MKMNKSEFLAALKKKLYGLPEEEIESSAEYYSEMIDDRIGEGMSEEAAVAAVGSVDEATGRILEEIPLTKLVRDRVMPKRKLNGWETALIIIGAPLWITLLLCFFVVVWALYIVLWALIVVIYAVDLALGVCLPVGIIGLFELIFRGYAASGLLALGAGLLCGGLAILLTMLSGKLTKGLISVGKNTVLWIKKCLLGKESN